MKAQREVAEAKGKEHVVQTGNETHVTKQMEDSSTKIVRRDDLVPPKKSNIICHDTEAGL